VLFGAFIVARLLSTGGLLITASIFGPHPFAPLGFYQGVLAILWIAACGRYEAAIVAARSESEAWILASLSQWICSLVLLVVAGLCILAVRLDWNSAVDLPAAALLMLPAGLFARVKLRVESLVSTRSGRPRVVAMSAVAQGLVQPVTTLLAYEAGAEPITALVLGDAVGHGVAALVVRFGNRRWHKAQAVGYGLKRVAREWRQMPIAGLPNALLAVAYNSAPALLTSLSLEPHLAGQAILALRLLDVPVQLVSSVATPTLQRAIIQDRAALEFVQRPMVRLASYIGCLFLTIGLAAHFLSPFFAHTRWPEVLWDVQWLAPSAALMAVTTLLLELVSIYRVEARALPRHLLSLMMLAICTAGLLMFEPTVPILALLLGLAALVRAILFATVLRSQVKGQGA
jgi:hypothetical protein